MREIVKVLAGRGKKKKWRSGSARIWNWNWNWKWKWKWKWRVEVEGEGLAAEYTPDGIGKVRYQGQSASKQILGHSAPSRKRFMHSPFGVQCIG